MSNYTDPRECSDITTLTNRNNVAEWILNGASRKECIARLREMGLTPSNADKTYYGALREMTPDTALYDTYKKGLVQVNLDRLESIVNDSITGDTGQKKVALQAIDQINKIIGAYSDSNSVMVARNKEGEEIIQIEFSR